MFGTVFAHVHRRRVGSPPDRAAQGAIVYPRHVTKTCDAKANASPPIGWPGPRAADTHTGTGSRTIGGRGPLNGGRSLAVSYTHLRAHETRHDLVCRLLLEKKKKK